MRKPLQVIILPYKKFDKTIEYCIFKRKDIGAWQAISGGVEQGEKLRQTAIREIEEETGVKLKPASLLKLESTADIPSEKIGKDIWSQDVKTVTEHAFGADFGDQDITIGQEHSRMAWLTFKQAQKKLSFDSNKQALQELNQILTQKR